MRTEPLGPTVSVRSVLVGAAALAAAVIVMSWFAPDLVPVERGGLWEKVRDGLGIDAARSVPSWLTVVLFAVAALGAHAQASWAWRRGGRVVGPAWWVLGAAMIWISVDHATAFHEAVVGTGPGWAGGRPVEVALVVLVGPAAAVLLVAGTGAQRVLLLLACAAAVTGQVVVGAGLVDVDLSPHRTSLLEASLQWTGALLVLAAASRPVARRD